MQSRPNTVSRTNGGTQCLAQLSHTKSKLKNNCKLDDLRTGFKIAAGYWFMHTKTAKLLIDVRQSGLF